MDQADLAKHRAKFPDSMTLGQAREHVRRELEVGTNCPCCTQRAQTYKRKLNSSMVNLLAAMVRAGGEREYVHALVVARDAGLFQQGDAGKLAYWHLVEEEPERRPDGGRSGWWRVTELGGEWLRGRATVHKYALVFDGRVRRLEGEAVTVHDAAGERFDFSDLMAGV